MKKETHMPAVSVDFDGVIHDCSSGWNGGALNSPLPGAIRAIRNLMVRYNVFILSTRDPIKIAAWLYAWAPDIKSEIIRYLDVDWNKPFWNRPGVLGITRCKLAALYYIDDRAIRHNSWVSTIELLAAFEMRMKAGYTNQAEQDLLEQKP